MTWSQVSRASPFLLRGVPPRGAGARASTEATPRQAAEDRAAPRKVAVQMGLCGVEMVWKKTKEWYLRLIKFGNTGKQDEQAQQQQLFVGKYIDRSPSVAPQGTACLQESRGLPPLPPWEPESQARYAAGLSLQDLRSPRRTGQVFDHVLLVYPVSKTRYWKLVATVHPMDRYRS